MFYDICNSSGTFIKASDDTTGILDTIEEKIAQFTMLPRQNGEVTIFFFFGEKQNLDWDVLIDLQPPYLQTFNILRYEIGQRYVPHYDAFNPAEYGPQQTQRVSPSFYNYLEFFFS